VQYFDGSLEGAYLKSLELNIRDKLPIVRKDKWQAAFRLVKHKMRHADGMTWESIAQRAVVSERLVYKMQATLRDNPKAFAWSWGRRYAETGRRTRTTNLEVMSIGMSTPVVGINLTANPDITAKALAMISEELPYALIGEWEDKIREVFLQRARDIHDDALYRDLSNAFWHLEQHFNLGNAVEVGEHGDAVEGNPYELGDAVDDIGNAADL
jgi:hypothetical protein